ncbi:MAG: hypothetical protein BroJett025_07340 [Patescibacteria group bacterium]|nr:MAG: hypothetical protein BroJett025_07340 [Patescibacteria group bacterium]
MTNENLENKIEQLTKQIQIQNSTRRNFYIAVVRGFGSALGATAVFGLVLAILFQIVRSIDYVPVLNNILSSQAIEEVIRRFTQPQ